MLAGLKVHLIIYGLLASSLVAASLTTKHYYTKTISLNQELALVKAEADFHKKDAQRLKDTAELDRIKSEELKKETEKALAELEKVKQHASVKVFLDTVVPTELNDWLRKRHPNKNDKAKTTKGVRDRNAVTSVRRQNSERYSRSTRKIQTSARILQQRQVLVAQIL